MTQSRIVLITGATDGLGRALAHRLAADGDTTLLLHGRSQERLDATADAIRDAHGGPRPRTFRADLASLAQVRMLAADVRAATDRLDALVSNAGIGGGEPDGRDRRLSADGYELRFAVNYLAGFLLTHELLPLLRASAPARVVNVASLGQQEIEFDDVMLEHGYDGMRAYCQSKLAQISSAVELSERVPASEVTFNSLHPATFMPTKMVLQELGRSVDSLETGVEATRRLVVDPKLAGVSGRFFDRQRETTALKQAYDKEARGELYRLSLELVGLPKD
ncbi:MAG: 3-oxoacyl-ACP reductase [Catenulispora sp. 13_1_20CM_3_70_7]|nr:MAG: 3-oxoacyl-ACP reductase [Catenulispora sp. 13_1_20CM_3_70_7]